MDFWWWFYGGGAPEFSTEPVAATSWKQVVVGRKKLFAQPCNSPCSCSSWSDSFDGGALDEGWEESNPGDWSVSSGGLLTDVPGAIVTAEREVDSGCGVGDIFHIAVSVGACSWGGDSFRVYFDWLDDENCQYVQFDVGACDPGDSCREATVTIHTVLDGEDSTVATAENPLAPVDWYQTVVVEIVKAGSPGEWYVYVATADDLHGISSCQTSCWTRTQPIGTRLGLGKSPDAPSGETVAFNQLAITTCTYDAVATMGFPWEWAPAAAVQVVTGDIQEGGLDSLLDPDEPTLTIAPDEEGTVDVIVPVAFSSETPDPRVINAAVELTDAEAGTKLAWYVWNYTASSWEKTLNGWGASSGAGELWQPMTGYAVNAIITDDHVSDGYAAIRLTATSSGEWTMDVRHVVGFRDPKDHTARSFSITFGEGFQADWLDGQTFELVYDEECSGQSSNGAACATWVYPAPGSGPTNQEISLRIGMSAWEDGSFRVGEFRLDVSDGVYSEQVTFYPTPPYDSFSLDAYEVEFSGGKTAELTAEDG